MIRVSEFVCVFLLFLAAGCSLLEGTGVRTARDELIDLPWSSSFDDAIERAQGGTAGCVYVQRPMGSLNFLGIRAKQVYYRICETGLDFVVAYLNPSDVRWFIWELEEGLKARSRESWKREGIRDIVLDRAEWEIVLPSGATLLVAVSPTADLEFDPAAKVLRELELEPGSRFMRGNVVGARDWAAAIKLVR